MSSDDISLSSLSDEDPKLADDERSRSRSKEHRHKHKKKHRRHSHKHKHRHKSSSRKDRKHKKHRSRHRRKDSSSSEAKEEDTQLVDELLEVGLDINSTSMIPLPEGRGRDVEIMRSATGNGILESMKIVVNNQNGSRSELVTNISSEEQDMSDDNSRDASRKADDMCMDSSDYLYIGEELNLEELMKQKAALQACLGAYMSDVEDDEVLAPEREKKPIVVDEEDGEEEDDDDDVREVPMVMTIEDTDDEELRKKERRKEREAKPKKRKRSSRPAYTPPRSSSSASSSTLREWFSNGG